MKYPPGREGKGLFCCRKFCIKGANEKPYGAVFCADAHQTVFINRAYKGICAIIDDAAIFGIGAQAGIRQAIAGELHGKGPVKQEHACIDELAGCISGLTMWDVVIDDTGQNGPRAQEACDMRRWSGVFTGVDTLGAGIFWDGHEK